MLPGMTVINPCDFNQTKLSTIAISKHKGPVYLRFGRPKVPNFTDEKSKFEIGKGWVVQKGSDLVIFATGSMVQESLVAMEELAKEKRLNPLV